MPGKPSVWVGLILTLLGTPQICPAVPLTARLLTPVSSYHSKRGDSIEALVAPPGCPEPRQGFPTGTIISGQVGSVRRVGLGLAHETASMRLDFSELRFPDGEGYALESRLVGIDNARERVDRRGVIHGIRATASLSSRLGSRIALEAWEHPFLLGPALVLESGLFRFPDPEIEYGRGTELTLDVSLPDEVAAPECANSEQSSAPDASNDLTHLVDGLSSWSYSKRQPQPMDLINLIFVGTRTQIETAFAAAGWTGARPNSMTAGLRVVRAIAEEREYALAPMRTLLFNGDEPGLRFQTALNTFEKRDHLRIWEQPGEWHDRPVWASAATRDIGATFSMAHPFGFTHEVQSNVDLERDKVVSNLQLTGCVESVQFVKREQAPDSKRSLRTDSRIAVVVLNACETPVEDFSASPAEPQPPLAIRVIRRLTLTTRNHFLRDNIVWRTGDATRIAVQAVRHWHARRSEQRLAASLRPAGLQ